MKQSELTTADLEIQYLTQSRVQGTVKEDRASDPAAFATPDIAVPERCRTSV